MSVSKRPFFSIIIPTFNRPSQLRACLAALGMLEYPRDRFEVIIVDDGGEDCLREVVRPFCDEFLLRLHRQENQGPAAARNAGAALAKGEFLAFTDDDCLPAPGWLSALAHAFAETPDAALGGRTVNALPANPYAIASQLLIDYLYGYFAGKADLFFTSNNFAISRRQYLMVGGFDPSLPLAAGEDREFCYRWQRGGGDLRFAPQAVVKHAHALTAVSFWRQHFRYGRGAYRYHQIRAARGERPLRLEPLSFYLDLCRYPLRRFQGAVAVVQTILLFTSQVANAAGFYTARLRS